MFSDISQTKARITFLLSDADPGGGIKRVIEEEERNERVTSRVKGYYLHI